MENFDDIKEGDVVGITTRLSVKKCTVQRTTKTQFVAGGSKYRKSNGGKVGGGDWDVNFAVKWNEELENKLVEHNRIREIKNILEQVGKIDPRKATTEQVNLAKNILKVGEDKWTTSTM